MPILKVGLLLEHPRINDFMSLSTAQECMCLRHKQHYYSFIERVLYWKTKKRMSDAYLSLLEAKGIRIRCIVLRLNCGKT